MKKLMILLVFLLGVNACNDDHNTVNNNDPFVYTLGGENEEKGHSTVQDDDGNIIVLGHADKNGNGDSDILLLKIDRDGNLIKEKRIGGKKRDIGYCIQKINDGFILTGSTLSFLPDNCPDCWSALFLIKVDNEFNVLRSIYFSSGSATGYSVKLTSDNGYIVTGGSNDFTDSESDVILIKTDSDGNFQWIKTFGGPFKDGGLDVIQTTDSGFAIAGHREVVEGDVDAYIIRVDSEGNLLWESIFRYELGNISESITETDDGTFILCCTTTLEPNALCCQLLEYNDTGNIIENRIFSEIGDHYCTSMVKEENGEFIISGTSYNEYPFRQMFLLKIDENFNVLWTQKYGDYFIAQSNDVKITSDKGFVLAGYLVPNSGEESDVFVVKTDSNGNI